MKSCFFCTNNIKRIDHKEAELLKRFLDPFGRLLPHKKTYVCARHQRQLATAAKRARFLAFLPFVAP